MEETAALSREIGNFIERVPEVTHYQIYAGTASPYNFNGLVRHYFLRRGPNVADIQVNLLPKGERSAQSHEVARQVRPAIDAGAVRFRPMLLTAAAVVVGASVILFDPIFQGLAIH